ncbi:MAG: MFS transporter [Leptospirales bacterium]|nr:MFS transporter [Leptospirales bacterium]
MAQQAETLPLSKQLSYAIGQLGWSTLVNIIGFWQVKFYIPTEEDNMPSLITRITFLAVLNAIAIIAAASRLWDAITDPLIASLSDRSKNPRGRRIPFMKIAALPAAVFLTLSFMPPDRQPTIANIVWLCMMLLGFFLFLTIYVTPYFALIAEFGHTPAERLKLSTWISVTYALGIIVASQAASIWNPMIEGGMDPLQARQIAIGLLAAIAAALMFVPVLTIDERRYSKAEPSSSALLPALVRTFKNRNFLHYTAADFAYFMGLTIIMTGLAYYLPVMLGMSEANVGLLMTVMIAISFAFYALVYFLAGRFGKRPLVLISFLWFAAVFAFIYNLGRLPASPEAQAYALVVLAALPIAFLGVLPNAILADIAEHSALKEGVRQEGMFYAARTFMQKMGQTLGIFVFAILTQFGIDRGNDLGLRYSGLAGVALCALAFALFFGMNEKKLLAETAELQKPES